MGKNNTRLLMQFTALVMVLTAAVLVEEAKSIPLCNVDTNDLEKCRPAITGNNPSPPGPDCCAVVKAANLECLCRYKPYLSSFGFDPAKVKTVLASCGANNPSCFPRSKN